ncbi:MAG: (2Fe-2S)-binding protein [Planctomycetes bacterium]|nr:(2Fe-2S)-binding protein [Planctomycetota bacterium]
MSIEQEINFTLNSGPMKARVPVTMDTLAMLRDVLRMTGTKYGCGEGECGACTILVDGTAINACLMFAVDCDGRELTTIEGVQTAEGLSDLQHAFVEHGAAQCGFCTPGLIMQGMWLVNRDPNLSAEQIKRGIEGNLCRCTGYTKVIDAIASTLKPDPSAAKGRS